MSFADLFGGPPQPPALPWETLPGSYGYIGRGQALICSREELEEICEKGSVPHRVWTPESGGLVPPETVPFLMAAIRRRLVVAARGRTIAFTLVGALVVGNAAGSGGMAWGSPGALYAALAAALIGLTLHGWWRAARLTPEGFRAMMREAEQTARLPKRPVVHTNWLVAMVGAGGAAQLLAMQAGAPEFGAMPAAVWGEAVLVHGQWWRLLTAAFVHGGLLHFAINLMALIALGRETEMYAGRGVLPLVFLVSVLGGTLLGITLPPDVPSVGSSGGLVGVIGFLGVLAWRRSAQVPPGFLKTVMINVALLVGIGLVGYAYIDNAGHAGGFITGGLLGLLIIPRTAARPDWEPGPALNAAGLASLAVLAMVSLVTAWVVITGVA